MCKKETTLKAVYKPDVEEQGELFSTVQGIV